MKVKTFLVFEGTWFCRVQDRFGASRQLNLV